MATKAPTAPPTAVTPTQLLTAAFVCPVEVGDPPAVRVELPFPVDVEFGFPVAWASSSAPAVTSTVIHALSLGCRVVVTSPEASPASGPASLCTQTAGVAIAQLSLQVNVSLSVNWSTMAVDPICVSVNPDTISHISSGPTSAGGGQVRKRTVEVGSAEMMDACRVACGWSGAPKVKMPKVKMEIVVWTGAWADGRGAEGRGGGGGPVGSDRMPVGGGGGGLDGPPRVMAGPPAAVRAARARVRNRRVEEGIVADWMEGEARFESKAEDERESLELNKYASARTHNSVFDSVP
jgi:hypothetical protein